MDVISEMQEAEIEIRALLAERPADVMTGIVEAYNRRNEDQRAALITVLAARLALAPAQKSCG